MAKQTVILRELVGRGATNYVARQLSLGRSEATILRGLSRFGIGAEPELAADIFAIGKEQREAAVSLTGQLRQLSEISGVERATLLETTLGFSIGKPIPLESIPVVPGLFGERPEGRRIRFDIDIEFETGRRFLAHSIETETSPSPDELRRAVIERLLEYYARYPGQLPYTPEDLETMTFARIINVGRRY